MREIVSPSFFGPLRRGQQASFQLEMVSAEWRKIYSLPGVSKEFSKSPHNWAVFHPQQKTLNNLVGPSFIAHLRNWRLLSPRNLGSLGYMGYNPLTNLLLASWDTQVVEAPKNHCFFHTSGKKTGSLNIQELKWFAINSMMIPNLYHAKMGGRNHLFHPSKKLWFSVPGGPVASSHLAET